MTDPTHTYRGYTISYWMKPVPSRLFDWDFGHDDYDGAPEHSLGEPTDHRHGSAESVQACKLLIDEIEDEPELGLDPGENGSDEVQL